MDVQIVIPILLSFFFASFIKGITGLGFSTICLPILTTFVDLKMSIPLVIIPSLASNALVMVQAGRFKEALDRFWPIYVSALPGLVLGVFILKSTNSSSSRAILGVILFAYALWALRTKTVVLPKWAETCLASPIGFVTGLVNGITGSQVLPILPFLLAIKMNKDIFVQAINISFTLSSIVMLLLLSKVGLLTLSIVIIALLGILPVALGIFLGGKLRSTLPEEKFRKVVLLFLLVIGFSLILRA